MNLKKEVRNALMEGGNPEQAIIDLINCKMYARDLEWIKRLSYVGAIGLLVIIGIVIISNN